MGYLNHAGATEERPNQVLRNLRSADDAEAVRGSARRPRGIPAPAEMFAVVREQQDRSDQGRSPLASPEASSGDMRQVRHDQRPARPPRRPESCEQQPDQLADSLRVMSSQVALVGGPGEAVGECGKGSGYGCSAWGQFAQAIHRWEICLGRVAPSPTELAPKGGRRLSAHAVEFMMGLPSGWVTDPALRLSRNEQLKALGNGVVPQQAEHALRGLLADVSAVAA